MLRRGVCVLLCVMIHHTVIMSRELSSEYCTSLPRRGVIIRSGAVLRKGVLLHDRLRQYCVMFCQSAPFRSHQRGFAYSSGPASRGGVSTSCATYNNESMRPRENMQSRILKAHRCRHHRHDPDLPRHTPLLWVLHGPVDCDLLSPLGSNTRYRAASTPGLQHKSGLRNKCKATREGRIVVEGSRCTHWTLRQHCSSHCSWMDHQQHF